MAANQVAAGAVRRTVHDTFLDTRFGYVDEQGGLVEMKAYDVLRTLSTPHGFKYSLVYILKGTGWSGTTTMSTKAIIGIFVFTTTPYVFTTVDRLIEDFRRDMAAVKKEIGR